MSALPTPAPTPNVETQEFWDGLARGVFLLRRCEGCGHHIWYPRFVCPACHGTATSWVEASGRGTIYTYTVVRRPPGGPWNDAVPFVVAYVELEEGPRVLSNGVDVDPNAVSVGMPVRVVFAEADGGGALYRFAPR